MSGPFSGLTGTLPRDPATGALVLSAGSGGAFAPTRGGVGLNFPTSVIWAANGKYMGFPSAARCADGSIFAVARRGDTHALDQGVIVGKFSYDGGQTWQPDSAEQTLITGATIGDAANDPRDPNLFTVPGSRRLYLSYFLNTFSGGVRNGTWLMWSDDSGKPGTWTTPTRIHPSFSAATRPKLFSDGKYRWPVYNLSPTEAHLLVADRMEGPWTDAGVVASGMNEHDVLEVSPTNWVSVLRATANQGYLSQSTDLGATWATPVAMDVVSSLKYDAWPALRFGSDGRLLLFARSGIGQRIVQCLDPANPMTPANWREPGQRGQNWKPLDVAPTGHSNWFVGKFQPWREGDLWMGAYMAEQDDAQTQAECRFGVLNERSILGNYSYVSTGEDTSAANGFVAGTFSALPTVDTVTVRAPANGAYYAIEASWASKQQSATTIQTFQVGVFRDGTQIPSTEMDQFIVAASVVSVAGSEYRHSVKGEVFLTGGVHTIELRYAQQSSVAQPRTFTNRLLRVRPTT